MSPRTVMLKGEVHIRWIPVLGALAACMALLELRHPGTVVGIISRAATGIAGIYGDIANSFSEIVRRLSNWYN